MGIKQTAKAAGRIVSTGFRGFSNDNAMTHAAALAFYTVSSMAPLLLVVVFMVGALGRQEKQQLIQSAVNAVGPQAGPAVKAALDYALAQFRSGAIGLILSAAAILVSATGLLVQLQWSLNRMWGVKAKPGQGIKGWFRKRLISLGLILGLGLLAMAAVILNAIFRRLVGAHASPVLYYVNNIGSLIIFIPLFAVIYKYLPDVCISWRDVWVGATVTGILFVVGKYLIGLYLRHSTAGSAYGAAGSLFVLITWIYYASVIFFLGAELTQAYARVTGSEIAPARHSTWAEGRKAEGQARQ